MTMVWLRAYEWSPMGHLKTKTIKVSEWSMLAMRSSTQNGKEVKYIRAQCSTGAP